MKRPRCSTPTRRFDIAGLRRWVAWYLLASAAFVLLAPTTAAAQIVGWGDNTHGQLDVPPGTYTQLAVNQLSVAALRADGTLAAWGAPFGGGAGPLPAGTFTRVIGAGLGTGSQAFLAIRPDGSLVGWGNPYGGVLATLPPGAFIDATLNNWSGIGIRADGTLMDWNVGSGWDPLPSGTFRAVTAAGVLLRTDGTLAKIDALSSWTLPAGTFLQTACGNSFVIGLRTDGTLVGVGDNNLGQINVPSGTFTQIACGETFGIALRADGTIVHWGDYAFGLHDVPTGRYSSIAAGGMCAFAIGGCPSNLTFVTQPVSQVVTSGQTATLSVAIGGATGGLEFQWRKNGTPLLNGGNVSGASSPTLTVNPSSLDDTGWYDVLVTAPACGGGTLVTTSESAILAVTAACADQPNITQQPSSMIVIPWVTATLTVSASSLSPMSYQWRRNGSNLSNAPTGTGSVITGADTPTLTISYASLADNGSAFDCVVTNACGSKQSNPAGLAVTSACPADFNNSGALGVQDIFDFLAAYFTGCP